MTGNEYQAKALRTSNYMDQVVVENPELLNGIMGLVGEAGEIDDLMKKHLFQHHPLDVEHVAKELGDVAWYLAVAAHAIGYKLDDILQMNVDKLMRRYPDGFDPERSMHRAEGDV